MYTNLSQMNQMNQISPKPLLPGLGYGGQPASQLSIAAAAVTLASGQLNGQLNGQLTVPNPAAGQPSLFQFPHQAPLPSPSGLGAITSNGLMARDEEGSEYLKHLNTLHYIKQLQQTNPIGTSIKSETDSENRSSPNPPNGQSNGASKLAKPQPVRHPSNASSLPSVPTSK